MARALHGVDVSAVISGHVVNNLRFADGIAAIGENDRQLDQLINGLGRENTTMSLTVNIDKTELQMISRSKTVLNIVVKGFRLQKVNEFFYFGGKFDDEGRSKPDVHILA